MKFGVLTILLLVFSSCYNVTENETEQMQIEVDSTELNIKTVEKELGNLKLTFFLDNPIDLQVFKRLKDINYTTTSVSNGKNYHFHPDIKDSIFYVYYYPTKDVNSSEIDRVFVLKFGENKHTYEDENEVLIELMVFNKDPDLGNANLVGLIKTELESEFGTDYLTLGSRIVYSNKNRVLIIELENSKVKSYRYIRLNTENVDQDLIRGIIE